MQGRDGPSKTSFESNGDLPWLVVSNFSAALAAPTTRNMVETTAKRSEVIFFIAVTVTQMHIVC
jgi:hypothetical protein